jgi:hypothetical protein
MEHSSNPAVGRIKKDFGGLGKGEIGRILLL